MNAHHPRTGCATRRRRCTFARVAASGCLALVSTVVSAVGVESSAPPAIPWDLAAINGLEVSSTSLGIRDRIRVVTLATSGCTPRSAQLRTRNPESGLPAEKNVALQGHAIEFEIEEVKRPGALLTIVCHERGHGGEPSKTFTLALAPRKTRR